MENIIQTSSRHSHNVSFWKRFLKSHEAEFSFSPASVIKGDSVYTEQVHHLTLDEKVSRRLNKLVNNKEYGVFVCLVTGLNILLNKYSGEEHIVISSSARNDSVHDFFAGYVP